MKLQSALLIAIFASATALSSAQAQDAKLCASPKEVKGFTTCADVAKAEQEGEVVIYVSDNEKGVAELLKPFNQLFPKVKTNFVRLQAGALYAKLMAERQANSFVVDVVQFSDMGLALDFQRRNGFRPYVSPQMAAYKTEYKSKPEGLWTWGAIIISGLAYNPKIVPADQAPKTWQDALDPKWADAVNVKVSNAGLQHLSWYELRQLFGPEYIKKFGELRPRAFDAYVQQYQRVVNGEDKLVHSAQYSGYLEFKAKGAPIEFVYPPEGLPAGPVSWGAITNAPHPNAAELFLDWLLSPLGQKAYGDALYYNSPRSDVPPPPGGVSVKELKLLFPADWNAFLVSRPEFAREWDRITGLRR